jgi:hypothetical protein
MPTLSVDIDVKCGACHKAVSATVRNGDVYADLCDKCSEQTYKDGYKAGHTEGYQEGYDAAADGGDR